MGLGFQKRQRVVAAALAKQKRRLGVALFGQCKPMVGGRHQSRGGAVVGRQHVVAPGGGLAGFEVAVNIGAAKAVDGLLGVANEQQRAIGRRGVGLVDVLKQAVLQRRGVLKLIEQRHRVLLAQALAQQRALRPGQSRVQTLQHVGKAKGARLALEPLQALGDVLLGMPAQTQAHGLNGIEGLQQIFQRLRLGRVLHRYAALAGFIQTAGDQAGCSGFQSFTQLQVGRFGPFF